MISEEDHEGSGRIPKVETGRRKGIPGQGNTADTWSLDLYPTGNGELLEFFLQHRSDQIHFS